MVHYIYLLADPAWTKRSKPLSIPFNPVFSRLYRPNSHLRCLDCLLLRTKVRRSSSRARWVSQKLARTTTQEFALAARTIQTRTGYQQTPKIWTTVPWRWKSVLIFSWRATACAEGDAGTTTTTCRPSKTAKAQEGSDCGSSRRCQMWPCWGRGPTRFWIESDWYIHTSIHFTTPSHVHSYALVVAEIAFFMVWFDVIHTIWVQIW